jgi:hypothetical protein
METKQFSRKDINQAFLKETFDYDAEIGRLRWKTSSRGRKAGDLAGTLQAFKNGTTGYRQISIGKGPVNVVTLEHRLVFLWYYGYLPQQIDHINRDKTDNRIENLRPANNSTNQMNTSVRSFTKSGLKGVHWDKSRSLWMARIKINGKHVFLGRFVSPEKAYEARKSAQHLHGEFASL